MPPVFFVIMPFNDAKAWATRMHPRIRRKRNAMCVEYEKEVTMNAGKTEDSLFQPPLDEMRRAVQTAGAGVTVATQLADSMQTLIDGIFEQESDKQGSRQPAKNIDRSQWPI